MLGSKCGGKQIWLQWVLETYLRVEEIENEKETALKQQPPSVEHHRGQMNIVCVCVKKQEMLMLM